MIFECKKRVSASNAGQFTVTEDGGMCNKYHSLIEVTYKDDGDSYANYYVSEHVADDFIKEMKDV